MPRISLVEPKNAGWFVRIVYGIVKRNIKKLTGRAEVVQPVQALAHHQRLLWGVGQMDLAVDAASSVPERLKNLAMLRAAKLVECPF